MTQNKPVLRCTGTPPAHSSALLGGVPNLQVDYTTGLKPLAIILSIMATRKAQTHIKSTQQKKSHNPVYYLYLIISYPVLVQLLLWHETLMISPRSLFPARNGTDASVRITRTASRREPPTLARVGQMMSPPVIIHLGQITQIGSVVLITGFNSYNKSKHTPPINKQY